MADEKKPADPLKPLFPNVPGVATLKMKGPEGDVVILSAPSKKALSGKVPDHELKDQDLAHLETYRDYVDRGYELLEEAPAAGEPARGGKRGKKD